MSLGGSRSRDEVNGIDFERHFGGHGELPCESTAETLLTGWVKRPERRAVEMVVEEQVLLPLFVPCL